MTRQIAELSIIALASIAILAGCSSRKARHRHQQSRLAAPRSPVTADANLPVDDRQAILVAALSSRQLLKFIHPGDSGTRRIHLAKNDWTSMLPDRIEAPTPIVLVPGGDKNVPTVEVQRLEEEAGRATVHLRLDYEGMSGEIHLVKRSDGWGSTGARLVER
jgi:hypothetical protein